MTNNPDYIERTILQLRREYGKDELVAALIKQVSEREIEIGKLKAEIDEANDKVEKIRAKIILERKKKVDVAAETEIKKDELYVRLQRKCDEKGNEIQTLKKQNVRLLQDVKELVNLNVTLKNKLNQKP